ncbi:hypothetical protein [Orientia tsutsugamushi]|uniref:hypothetical protein n=1 Tax=Orientia tsutsugamushi TaxID=784 RepID=UPI0013A5625B|nr:hypothetical protein [Orientia tsutsugamushi]
MPLFIYYYYYYYLYSFHIGILCTYFLRSCYTTDSTFLMAGKQALKNLGITKKIKVKSMLDL